MQGSDGQIVMPPLTNLSSEKLDRAGAFLLEDGMSMLLWIGKMISQDFLVALFGVSSLDGVDTSQV